jgi:hypothetical protein
MIWVLAETFLFQLQHNDLIWDIIIMIPSHITVVYYVITNLFIYLFIFVVGGLGPEPQVG